MRLAPPDEIRAGWAGGAFIGRWTLPSGNAVTAVLTPYRLRVRLRALCLILRWQDGLPLALLDGLHYRAVVRPAITARVREYLEVVQRGSMVIEP
jgi:hypothetical protein